MTNEPKRRYPGSGGDVANPVAADHIARFDSRPHGNFGGDQHRLAARLPDRLHQLMDFLAVRPVGIKDPDRPALDRLLHVPLYRELRARLHVDRRARRLGLFGETDAEPVGNPFR
jgi:hypothetical protein